MPLTPSGILPRHASLPGLASTVRAQFGRSLGSNRMLRITFVNVTSCCVNCSAEIGFVWDRANFSYPLDVRNSVDLLDRSTCLVLTPFWSAKHSTRTGGGALWSGADGPRPGAGRSATWCRSTGSLPDGRTVRALGPDGPRVRRGGR
jgi:hypothetical protein